MSTDEAEKRLYHALAFYADPETYFATSIAFDPPCGAFREDFSLVPDSDFEREMPGKRAREALDSYLAGITGASLQSLAAEEWLTFNAPAVLAVLRAAWEVKPAVAWAGPIPSQELRDQAAKEHALALDNLHAAVAALGPPPA